MILTRAIEIINGIAYVNLKADTKIKKLIVVEKHGEKVEYIPKFTEIGKKKGV